MTVHIPKMIQKGSGCKILMRHIKESIFSHDDDGLRMHDQLLFIDY